MIYCHFNLPLVIMSIFPYIYVQYTYASVNVCHIYDSVVSITLSDCHK